MFAIANDRPQPGALVLVHYAKALAAAALAASASLIASQAGSQERDAVGLWRTLNDSTGQAEALVRITHSGGELRGEVVKVFSPPAPSPNPLCEECSGKLRNKPVVGMTILRGLRWDGEQYAGGEILDPDSGTVYRCRLRVVEGGNKLEVRGFIGVALFGRTQTWLRERRE